jgi:hypothetical protein
MKEEKEALKRSLKQGKDHKKNETKLFDKVKYDLLSNQSSQASLRPDNQDSAGKDIKLDKQAEGYEKMLIKLESDIR